MAFQLAEICNIKHTFNRTLEKAGKDWFDLFTKRHPSLSVRKPKGISQARAESMDRTIVSQHFKLLEQILTENELVDKPGHIFNMDETGCQLNNRPGHVIAEKGSKNVVVRTSAEKGETITVIACCNAEGNFLPPACVFKGKNKKAEFEDGMLPGSVVYMGDKSAYVNANIFYVWLKEHFSPRKPQGKVILILDGHTSHCNNIEMLEYAAANEIILFCLPPHTTQFLQPLDRAFFKSFKGHYYAACNLFIKNNPTRKLNRLQFGHLLSSAWNKSTTPSNGISAFEATGIYPLNPDAIPDYAFLANIQPENENLNQETLTTQVSISNIPITPPHDTSSAENQTDHPTPQNSEITPGKILNIISPVPSTSGIKKIRSLNQTARILTSTDNIFRQKTRKNDKMAKPVKKGRKRTKIRKVDIYSTDEESDEIQLADVSDSPEDFGENMCAGCGEDYNETKKKTTGYNVSYVKNGLMTPAQHS